MSYTARDYTALAKALAPTVSDVNHTDISAIDAVGNILSDIADTLGKLNPRFDRERFLNEAKAPAVAKFQEKVQ